MTEARDIFDAAYGAARARRVLALRVEALERAGQVRAQGYGPRVSGTRADYNGTDATVAALDRLPQLRARLAQLDATIARARRCLVGTDGTRGVALLVGDTAASCAEMHYCDGLTWAGIEMALHLGTNTAHRLAATAIDMVDAVGEACAVMGVGLSCD